MSRIAAAFVLAILPLLPASAQAPAASKSATEMSKFLIGTRLGYITCADKYRGYLERWELFALMTEGQKDPKGTPPSDADVADCIHMTGIKGQALYKDAVKAAPAPKSKTAFEEYMTAWNASLKDIRKKDRESVSAFRARTRKVEERLNQLQSRLESTVNVES
jgi:hypothetical protein